MPESVLIGAWIVGAYAIGSIPFGVVFARLRGVDVTRAGSGNIGATNVARTVGKELGLLVLILDAGKGAVPMIVGLRMAASHPAMAELVIVGMGLAPVLGHCFSPWLGLRGGKGVATSLGVVVVLSPALAGLGVGIFALIFGLTRIASLSSLGASIALVPLLYFFGERDVDAVLIGLAVLVIVIQHRANLRRLWQHRELKV